MTRIPDPQIDLQGIVAKKPVTTNLAAAVVQVLTGDARTVRILVATSTAWDVANGPNNITVGVVIGGVYYPLAGVNPDAPSTIMKIEDFGQWILGDIYALGANGQASNVTCTQIVRSEQVCD